LTPVFGFGPRVGPRPPIRGEVFGDFNERLKPPTMWMHFSLEFIFSFCDRLMFWRADRLLRTERMQHCAQMCAGLQYDEVAAVRRRMTWRERLPLIRWRYPAVPACSMRNANASRGQFEIGCGLWVNFLLQVSLSASPTLGWHRRSIFDTLSAQWQPGQSVVSGARELADWMNVCASSSIMTLPA